MPLTAAAVATAGVGAAQLISGASKEKKAKQELARLHQPLYGIQPEYYENRNIMASEAGQGIPSITKDYLTSEAGKGLGTGISALTQTGGGVNDISKLMDVYNRSLRNIGAEDAETHLKNIQYFANANKDLAGQKTMQWTINEYQPYQAKLKELTKRREAAEQNIWGGLQTIAGAGMAYGQGKSNANLMTKLFGDKTDPFQPNVDAFEGLKQTPMATTVNPEPGASSTIDTDLATLGRPLIYQQ